MPVPPGDVLICKNNDGNWEFPHDKVRTNETEAEAASRVAWEQLGMKVAVGKMAMIGRKYTQDGYVEHIACGNITHNTHTKYDYTATTRLSTSGRPSRSPVCIPSSSGSIPLSLGGYGFTGDDKNFMAKYDPWINGREIPDCRMY